MGSWSLGSVSTALINLIPNVPTSISGAQLLDLVDRRRLQMETWTGATIGSVGIAETYQPALVSLSAADLLRFMHLQGGDTSIDNIRIGNAMLESAKMFEEKGMKELKALGHKILYYKAWG